MSVLDWKPDSDVGVIRFATPEDAAACVKLIRWNIQAAIAQARREVLTEVVGAWQRNAVVDASDQCDAFEAWLTAQRAELDPLPESR